MSLKVLPDWNSRPDRSLPLLDDPGDGQRPIKASQTTATDEQRELGPRSRGVLHSPGQAPVLLRSRHAHLGRVDAFPATRGTGSRRSRTRVLGARSSVDGGSRACCAPRPTYRGGRAQDPRRDGGGGGRAGSLAASILRRMGGYREQLAANPGAIELPRTFIDNGWVRVAVDDKGTPIGFSVVIPGNGRAHELDGLFVEPTHAVRRRTGAG